MAAEAAGSLTIRDLPQDVLECVFALAGTQPAIVGVCKQWAQVYWGSQGLWRHLIVSPHELDQPVATSPSAPLLMFQEVQRAHQLRRLAGWQEAKRAQLQRVGHLAEAATFEGRRGGGLQLSTLLPLLSPALGALTLHWLDDEQAVLLLPSFSQLTSLEVTTEADLSNILPRLPALQRLKMGGGNYCERLLQALRSLHSLTSLELEGRLGPDMQQLRRLQPLRQLVLHSTSWRPHTAACPPPPASFASLVSYSFAVRSPFGILELAGFQMWQLSFELLQSVSCGQATGHCLDSSSASGWPGSLRIDGVIIEMAGDWDHDDGDNNDGSDSDGGSAASAAAGQPATPQMNALLEAAVPPGATLRRLTLSRCRLEAAALQRLPALASLQLLELQGCVSPGGLGAALQALVQRAPALTSLRFEAPGGTRHGRMHSLHSCPAYLLGHPSLRSAVILNRQLAEWDLEQALHRLPIIATAVPVLEHLATDGFAFMPPALSAVSSLRSLAFLDQPQFEFNCDTVEHVLALPHLTSLTLPQLTHFEQQAAEQLRRGRPGLNLQVQPKQEEEEGEEKPRDQFQADPCIIS